MNQRNLHFVRVCCFSLPFPFVVKFDDAAKDDKMADEILDNANENVVMKALDGFLIILSHDGDVIYVSENIQEHIGIQQVCYRCFGIRHPIFKELFIDGIF